MSKHQKISGFRVIGIACVGHGMNPEIHGKLNCWAFSTRKEADTFAQFLTDQTGDDVQVCAYLGSWRRKTLPVEFVEPGTCSE